MRHRISATLGVALLLAGAACAPPEASARPDGVTRVRAHVRGIT